MADQFFGVGTLAGEEQLGRFAPYQPQQDGGQRQGEGAETPGDGLGELPVVDASRRYEIDGTLDAGMFDQKRDGPYEIFQINPRKVLHAGAEA